MLHLFDLMSHIW